MNCPKCGSPVSSRKRCCEACGTDLAVFRKIIGISNNYYNKGLEKAKVRDLSGAVNALRRSLEFNKKNTPARNLLGLVYYEMGETVMALSQWVISKNFEPQENPADDFLEKVQDNPNELDNTNQAIKKYNLALASAKEGNEDLAVIQLKKVVNLHPNFLRAIHLLALLYIRAGENDRARRYLKRALAIDVANTTTLKYLAETGYSEEDNPTDRGGQNSKNSDGDESGRGIAIKSTYREEKPNVIAYLNLIFGAIIGIAVVYYLFIPTMKSKLREEYDSQKVDYSAELAAKSAEISQKDNKIYSLTKQVDALQEELDGITIQTVEVEVNAESYNSFFEIWEEYTDLKSREYTDEELNTLALELSEFDANQLENQSAKSILAGMRSDIYPLAARKVYRIGRDKFDEADYETSARYLKAAVAFDEDNDAAIYYLGKSLQAMGSYEDAIYYYKLMLEVCPNSTLKEYIPQRLSECGAEN